MPTSLEGCLVGGRFVFLMLSLLSVTSIRVWMNHWEKTSTHRLTHPPIRSTGTATFPRIQNKNNDGGRGRFHLHGTKLCHVYVGRWEKHQDNLLLFQIRCPLSHSRWNISNLFPPLRKMFSLYKKKKVQGCCNSKANLKRHSWGRFASAVTHFGNPAVTGAVITTLLIKTQI